MSCSTSSWSGFIELLNWNICTIGKPALAFARSGVEEYLGRLQRYTAVSVTHGKERGAEKNSLQLLTASEGTHRIALDERGRDLSTAALVETIDCWELDGSIKTVSLLIGGADGHTADLRSQCVGLWRLSSLTLQHELALIVLLEALYRAYTIKRGEPYHR